MLSKIALLEIKRRADISTPGEWWANGLTGSVCKGTSPYVKFIAENVEMRDLSLFTNAKTDILKLLAGLWADVHGIDSWWADVWVWVVDFRKI